MNRDHCLFFEIASKYCISGSFVDYDGYFMSSTGFLCVVVDIIFISPRWWSRRTCPHLLLWELQNYNLLLNNHQQENVGSYQKRIFHVQGKRRSPSKMVGRAKLDSESNPACISDSQRAQTKPCVLQEAPQRLSQACLWVSPAQGWVSSGLLQGQRLCVQQTWVWHKPSWRRLPLTPHRAVRPYTGLGKQTLGGPSRTLCALWPHKRLTQTCLWVSGWGVGLWWPASGSGALSVAVCAWDLLKEVTFIFITSTIVWPQVKQQEGNTPQPIKRKLD